MAAPLAKMGDLTSHGGVIVSGATRSLLEGAPIARMGDLHACPIPGHAVNPIITGSVTTMVEGAPAARMGDLTACGAMIIASSATTLDT
jgi:uncharacterized Zn-binding protein involved in type VI secretion